jgi:hypothetical protein
MRAFQRRTEGTLDLAHANRVPLGPGGSALVRQEGEEGGLARELEALETGWRLGMHDSDWESLVGLAHRYGWRPSEGSEHYLPREGRRVVSPSEARALAEALEEALPRLPGERRRELRAIVVGALGGFVEETSRAATGADYERYFSWGRRWIVAEVATLCREGAVEIRPI